MWFNVSLFQYFFQSTMVPTLVENSCVLVCWLFFLEHYYYDWNCNIAARPYYCWWTHAYCIETMASHTHPPTYLFIVWREDASLPAMFNLLCSSTNQQLFKRTSEIKVVTMKIMDDFCYEWKPSHSHHKIETFHGEQRWMGHKGGHW